MTKPNNGIIDLDPKDMGIDDEPKKQEKVTPKKLTPEEATAQAIATAAANAAVAAQANTNASSALMNASKIAFTKKKEYMLHRCKKDKVVKLRGEKIYAQYFGKDYTILFNGIPVTIRFDGTEQKFPKFIAEYLQKKISKVSEGNVSKEITEGL